MPIVLLLLTCALPAGGELYRGVVSRALARAQSGLLAGVDLAADHSRWEDPWVVASAHFEVRTTASYAEARRVADGLEYVHGEFVKLLGPLPPTREKGRVWIFPTIGDYNRFGEQNGAEHSSMLGSFYAAQHAERPVATYHTANPTLLGMWVTHSAVHQVLEQAFGPQQLPWVDEGLASYFSLFWDWSYGASELERIERSGTFIPLARLLSDPVAAYVARPQERFIELGMLVHFLLGSWEATRSGEGGAAGTFQEFLRAAVRGQPLAGLEFGQVLDEALELLEEDFRGFEFPGG